MEQATLNALNEKLASNDPVLMLEAALDIIKSVNDREMRTEYTVFLTKYQSAKDSSEMMNAYEEMISHVKKQYAMILAQGFTMGMGYQRELFTEALHRAQEESTKVATPKDEQKDGESE